MATAEELLSVDAACPLLGLAADHRTHYTFPHSGHRCQAGGSSTLIQPWHQAAHCLCLGFKECDRYPAKDAEAVKATPKAIPTESAFPPGRSRRRPAVARTGRAQRR
jgi:hypothetical protein